MAGGFTVRITGLKELLAKWDKPHLEAAVRDGLDAALVETTSSVQRRIGGKHTVTGFMRASVTPSPVTYKKGHVASVPGGGKVYYTPFVEHGTGVYGKHHTPIVPVQAKALAWTPKTATGKPKKGKGGAKIVRKSVKGQPGVHMFRDTATEDHVRISKRFREAFVRALTAGKTM